MATAPIIPNTPDTMQGYTFVYANIPLLVFCAAIVSFRVWWRCIKHNGGALNRADICVVIALLFNVVQVAAVSTAILRWGFGHHAPYMSAEERYMSLLYFFIFQCFVKNTRKFRIICWALIIHISLALIALSVTTIFQCQPVQYSWDKSLHGKCINLKAFWYGQSGWNTLMDVIVLVLPIPLVVKLQMNRRGKLGLFAVFMLGTFVCFTSIERMISLNFNATFVKDFTWATGTSVIWTQVESTVGVICACAPSLRAPLARWIPVLFGATNNGNSYELSDDNSRRLWPRSGNWGSKGSKKRSELDSVLQSNYQNEESQEAIAGIERRVSVDVAFAERPGETDMDGTKAYPSDQFERHIV